MSNRRKLAGYGCLSAIIATVGLAAGGCVILQSGLNSIGTSHRLRKPPDPKYFGTAREIGTRGDDPDPGARYGGVFPSDDQTQERAIGGLPARFSGYTTWVRSADRVAAKQFTEGYEGSYLRVRVTVFNRDTEEQHVCACDFKVWTKSHGYREADAVAAPTLAAFTMMPEGARLTGDVYLYVGHVPGPYFVVFDPDAHVGEASSTARGVWEVPRERPVRSGGSRTTTTARRPTPG